jgi:hypothetical protein
LWPETVRSTERGNAAAKIAREAMRKALADEAAEAAKQDPRAVP